MRAKFSCRGVKFKAVMYKMVQKGLMSVKLSAERDLYYE